MGKLRAALASITFVLAGCGGDSGSGGDFITADGARTTRFDEADSTDAPWGHDPEIFGQEEESILGIEIGLWSDYTGDGPADGFTDYLFLNFKSTTEPADVQTGDNSFSTLYREGADLYVANAFIDDSSGTATLDRVDDIDGVIAGDYLVTMCKSVDGSDFPTDCAAGSLTLSGTFLVTREPKGTGGCGKD
jgi:hypothetical protein